MCKYILPAKFAVIIFVVTVKSLEAKPSTCTPEYAAMGDSTMCMEDSNQIVSQGVSSKDIRSILNTHNNFRRDVSPSATDLFKLVWDNKVAQVAQKCSNQCRMFHDDNRNVAMYPKVKIGQNVAAGFGSWKKAITAWHSEVGNFEYGKGGNGKTVGHYTQVVNKHTVKIGCGFTKCKGGGKFYVCNYAASQMSREMPYTEGAQCSACKDNCKDGLCDCGGLLCLNGGQLDINNCKCNCPKAYSGKTCNETRVCGGQKCFNGGKLDSKFCKCECPKGTSGKECEIAEDMSSGELRCIFSKKPRWYGTPSKAYCASKKDYRAACKSKGGFFGCGHCAKYYNVKDYCPWMCGYCG